MATMVGLFSSIGEHMPIFRHEKMIEATPESWVIINSHFSFNQFDQSHIQSIISGEQAALQDHLHAPLGGSFDGHLHRVDFRYWYRYWYWY